MSLDKFSSGRILAGGLFSIFLLTSDFLLFYNAKKICMHDNFYFYATTVNIPTGFYTVDLLTWGLGFYNDTKMECSKGTLFFFSNMQQ
jgi:hypothetical protein